MYLLAYFLLQVLQPNLSESWSMESMVPCLAQNVHDLILGAQRAKSRILSRERWNRWTSATWQGAVLSPHFFVLSFLFGFLGTENGGCLYLWQIQWPLENGNMMFCNPGILQYPSFRQAICWFLGYLSAPKPGWWFAQVVQIAGWRNLCKSRLGENCNGLGRHPSGYQPWRVFTSSF